MWPVRNALAQPLAVTFPLHLITDSPLGFDDNRRGIKGENMNLVMIGSGYVGLVTGACFAEFGHSVTCVDKDQDKIRTLNSGKIPIYEPGLQEIVEKNRSEGHLRFTCDTAEAVSDADVVFIAVGTPFSNMSDGYADLSYVYAAAREIGKSLRGYTVIVNKSTIPVGTGRQVERVIRETNSDADFDVVSNPEFLREGAAIDDFMHPERVVIGTSSERAAEVMRQVYEPLCKAGCPFIFTNLETSELTKYAANAFLATKVSFINEMANLCEALGADVCDVSRGIGLDSRIGQKFLAAGPGYGGSCFPKDTWALLRTAQEHGIAARVVEAIIEVNAAQKARMVTKIRKALGGSETGKTIGVLGLSYKPDTDDMRDAPALTIIPRLLEMGARVKAHDPESMSVARELLPGMECVSDPYDVADGADAVVLMTEWKHYKSLDLARLKSIMKSPIFVDLRNLFEPDKMKSMGFKYVSVGR